MGCLLLLLALVAPRLVIVLLALFSDYLGRAYDSLWFPFIGFLFLPMTTLAYAWAINVNGSLEGGWIILVILAVLIDTGSLSAGGKHASKRE